MPTISKSITFVIVLATGVAAAAPERGPPRITPELVHTLIVDQKALEAMIDPKNPPLIDDAAANACSPDDAACLKAVPPPPHTAREFTQQMRLHDQKNLGCDNTFVSKADPDFARWDPYGDVDSNRVGHALRYATCDLSGDTEYARSYHLLFVIDRKSAVRLAAMVIDEVGTRRAWLPRVADQIARRF